MLLNKDTSEKLYSDVAFGFNFQLRKKIAQSCFIMELVIGYPSLKQQQKGEQYGSPFITLKYYDYRKNNYRIRVQAWKMA